MSDLKRDDAPRRHKGPAHSSPYPVSRLSPPVDLVDAAREIQHADRMIGAATGAKLEVIAEQIRRLQEQAREVLEEGRAQMDLHRAECRFARRPGHVYYLYRRGDGSLYFSMISPDEWGEAPPHEFQGAYRLQSDMSWVPADGATEAERREVLLRQLTVDPDAEPR